MLDAQFHGVLIDGQATTGYNTDNFIHPTCADPHPVDSGTTIDITVDRTVITGAGQLDGDDISQATGCPQDFDGLRVDQGGVGDLSADLDDGFDIDEEDAADLTVAVSRSEVNDNRDEGMDMDEAGPGSIVGAVIKPKLPATATGLAP